MTLKLFEISRQLRELENLALDEDIPPEVIRDTVEGLEGDFDAKAIDVAKFVLSLQASAEATKRAAEAMARRSLAMDRRAAQLKAYLLFQLQTVNKMRITCPDFTIRRVANPPAVVVTDEQAVPLKFWVQPPPPPRALSKSLISEALKAGEAVPGVYRESGERVDIKI